MTALPNVKEPAQQGQTKVEGWVDGIVFTRVRKDISSVRVFSHQILEGMSPATLIIAPPGSTAAPEVMTKEEHEALVARLRSLVGELTGALDSTECLDNGCPLPTWQKGYDEMCAKRSAALLRAKAEGFNHEEQKA